jgi:hypothetical protein
MNLTKSGKIDATEITVIESLSRTAYFRLFHALKQEQKLTWIKNFVVNMLLFAALKLGY